MPPNSLPQDSLFIALDTRDKNRAKDLVQQLWHKVGGFKIGKEFFTAHGPQGVRDVLGDAPLFLDLKFHDIPNTVGAAVRAAIAMRPKLITLHASGGQAMLRAAVEARDAQCKLEGVEKPLLIAVTLLTSLSRFDLADIGYSGSVEETVERLARLSLEAGLDGVVASGRELSVLRSAYGEHLRYVVPGLRPSWAARNDQARSLTPAQALKGGADFLVIGRPITQSSDPVGALEKILEEMDSPPPEK